MLADMVEKNLLLFYLIQENNTTVKYECIKKADKLLYNAKKLGRNRIEA